MSFSVLEARVGLGDRLEELTAAMTDAGSRNDGETFFGTLYGIRLLQREIARFDAATGFRVVPDDEVMIGTN